MLSIDAASRPVSPKTIIPLHPGCSTEASEARPRPLLRLSTTMPPAKPKSTGSCQAVSPATTYVHAVPALDPRPLEDLHRERSYLLHDLQKQGIRATRLFHRYAAVEARLAAAAAASPSSESRRCKKEASLVRAKIAESTQQEKLLHLRLGEIHVELQNRDRWLLVHQRQSSAQSSAQPAAQPPAVPYSPITAYSPISTYSPIATYPTPFTYPPTPFTYPTPYPTPFTTPFPPQNPTPTPSIDSNLSIPNPPPTRRTTTTTTTTTIGTSTSDAICTTLSPCREELTPVTPTTDYFSCGTESDLPRSARSGSGSLLSPLSPCFEPGFLVEGAVVVGVVPELVRVVEGVAEEGVRDGVREGVVPRVVPEVVAVAEGCYVEDEGVVVVGAGEDVEVEVGEGVGGEVDGEVNGEVEVVGIVIGEREEEGEGIGEEERIGNGEVMGKETEKVVGGEMENGDVTGTNAEEEKGEALIWVQLVDEPVLGASKQGEVGGEREWVGLENADSGCDSTAGGKSECRAADDNGINGVNGVDESRDSDSPSKWDSDAEETQAWRDKLRRVSLYLPKSFKAKDKRMSLPYFKNMWSKSRRGSLQSTAG